VTVLFTDVEGSTRRWEHDVASAAEAIAGHEAVVRGAIEARGGYVFAGLGDGFAAAFAKASDAVAAAVDAQRALLDQPWGRGDPVRVRMGLHTGEAVERDGDYFGPTVNRAARIMAAAHGGQVLLSAVTAALVDRVDTVDLGEHQLRDLPRRERIFQVTASGLRSEFPALRTGHETPTNLPTVLPSFVGRQRELDELVTAVTAARLVTLIGVGGAGKTRLAVEGGRRLLGVYADGVWFVDLAPLRDPGAISSTVARAMRRHDPLAEAEGPVHVRDRLAAAVGHDRVLIVMDNCEHLLGPCAEFVVPLLEQCPNVAILATSREVLNVLGERTLSVGALTLPADDSIEAVRQSAAGCLFVERAAAVRSSFALSAQSASSVAALCRRLDGLPLALELAAARTRLLSPAQINARLDDALQVLSGVHGGATRHETLRTAMSWSYELLSDLERSLFRRLAVFRGGFTLDGAEAVATDVDGDVLGLLGSLVDKSLVVAVDADDGGRRFQLLEVVRQFATAKLNEHGETDAARLRHREHLLAVIERSATTIDEGTAGFRALAAEVDNVRAATSWSLGRGEDEAALRLVASYPCWQALGLLREQVDLLARALETSSPDLSAEDRGNALFQVTMNAAFLGDLRAAAQFSRELRSLVDLNPDLAQLRGSWCFAQAYIEYFRQSTDGAGDRRLAEAQSVWDVADQPNGYPAANAMYFAIWSDVFAPRWFQTIADQGLERARAAGQVVIETTILFLADIPAAMSGDVDARSRCEDLLERLDRPGSEWVGVFMAFLFGLVQEISGDFAAAALSARRVLTFCRQAALRCLLPGTIRAIARLAAAAELSSKAMCLFGAADAIDHANELRYFPLFARLDDPRQRSCRRILGEAAADQHRTAGAAWSTARAAEEADLCLAAAEALGWPATVPSKAQDSASTPPAR
jgi:predicted ATPase/class 3 adenylate cyclase